jgi:hypothetical protein
VATSFVSCCKGGSTICVLQGSWVVVLDCSQLGFEDVWLFMMVHCWIERGKVFQVCDFFGEVLFKFCLLIS